MPSIIYYIDSNILGTLLGIETDELQERAYTEYLKRLIILVIEETKVYFNSIESDPVEATRKAADLVEKVFGASGGPQMINKITPEDIQKNAAVPEELRKRIKGVIEELNKFIYESYSKTINEETRQKLNTYIESIEEDAKSSAKYLKIMVDSVEEIMQEKNQTLPMPQINLTPPSSN